MKWQYVESKIVVLISIIMLSYAIVVIRVGKIIPEDVNRDGQVTAQDYIQVKNYIMNKEY